MSRKVETIITANATGFSRGVQQASQALGGFEGQLRGFQSVAANALSFAGIGLGAAEIIKLADAYGQMNARLRLVTQFSGDFVEIQESLRDSARDSRADLGATVDLYTQLAPALKGVGISGKESVAIVTTINKAIALSGASAQAAEAALVQLAQGFAGGALRGEELNSIMEQTPALAQAIADGLGVSRGALRQLGSEGKLTAEVVAGALRNVAAQVDQDFKNLPLTVGQAITNLKNELLTLVGESNDAVGGTTVLAESINRLSESVAESAPFFNALATGIGYVAMAADGAYRVIKIMMQTLVGTAAMALAGLTGNFKKVKEIYDYMGSELQANLMTPLLGSEKEKVVATADSTSKRRQLERQLADEVTKLEKLKAYEAGQASDNIAATDKANINARIADQQRLVDAVRSAWQSSLDEAKKATEKQQQLLQKAGDYRQRGQDAAFNAGLKGMTPEQQALAKRNQLETLTRDASFASSRAQVAAMEGDVKKFEQLAGGAEAKLLAMMKLAEEVGGQRGAESAQDAGNQLAKLQEAAAKIEGQKAAAAQQQAEAQAGKLRELEGQLEALKESARNIEVQANVAQAQSAIAGIKAQLAEIKDKTVTVTVNTVNAGAPTPALATGGLLRGPGTGTSDSILARLSNGEYVIRAAAVSHYGPQLLDRINSMSLPKFASGGLVGKQGGASGSPLVLDFGKLGRFQAEASADTAQQLVRVFQRAALARGKR